MTDREFANLKGRVKSVRTISINIDEEDGKQVETMRLKRDDDDYDENGNLIKRIDNMSEELIIYTFIDGAKTAQITEGGLSASNTSRGELNKLPETKLTAPDPRYSKKFAYEYDKKNRITKETVYRNDGKISAISTFEYDEKGNLIKETYMNDGDYSHTETHKFDKQGIEIGSVSNEIYNGKTSISNTVYSNYKFDAQGNWTKRTSIFQRGTGKKKEVVKQDFYREITYY